MKISDVRVRIVKKDDSKLKAVASITIDDCFVIHDIKVIEGPDRLFVAMPSRKETNGAFRDIVHPISPAARLPFEQAVLDAYRRELASRSAEETAHPAFAASASLFPSAGSIPKYY